MTNGKGVNESNINLVCTRDPITREGKGCGREGLCLHLPVSSSNGVSEGSQGRKKEGTRYFKHMFSFWHFLIAFAYKKGLKNSE